MKKLSDLSVSFYFKLGLVGVVLLSLYTGLADSDWYWQVKLGEGIVKYGKLNDFSSLVWVDNLGYYLDHEWLSNIIFYLLSLLPYGVVITKFLLVSVCCFSVYLFIKNYHKENSEVVVLSTVFILMICSITVFKVKPYMFSFIFLLLELYFLDRLPTKKSKIGLFIISVLWINMHGSYPLFLCVFGLYALIGIIKKELKIREYVVTFLVSFLGSFINPFGYKLVLFNLLHNSDSTMKVLIEDWKAVDCKTEFGVVVFLVIAVYIFALSFTKCKFNFAFFFSLAMLFLTLGSARHMLYLSVSIIYLLSTSSTVEDINLNKKIAMVCTYLAFVIGASSSISLFKTDNFERDYMFSFVDESTVGNIKNYYEDSNYEGLFLNSCFNAVLGDGIRTYTCGIYPIVSEEVKNEIYLTWYSSEEDIEKIIRYYNLTGFIVDKYSIYEGYSRESVLYQYLANNDDYVCLNDTDNYGFFIEKSLVEK